MTISKSRGSIQKAKSVGNTEQLEIQACSEKGENNMALSDQEVLASITAAVAAANAAATNANTAAASANAAANQSSAGAAGGVAGARTQSNAEQASLNDAILKTVTQNVDSDIGVTEAWSSNVKRTYDIHQSYDHEVMVRNRTHFDNLVSEQLTHLADVHQLALQSLANNQNQSNTANNQMITLAHVATDRIWNINETDLAAKSAAIITDMVLAEMAKRSAVKA